MFCKKCHQLITALFCIFFFITGYANNDDTKNKESTEFKLPITSTWALTSNYIFRGLTNTNNIGAVQGGFTYTVPNVGIYASIWGSNVKFPNPILDEFGMFILDGSNHIAAVEAASTPTFEFDTVVGISNTIKEHFTYNLSLVRYSYPQASFFDYNEVIGNIQYYFLTGLIGHSNDVYASGENGTYYNVGINYDIPEKYALGMTGVNLLADVGYYDLPSSTTIYTSYKDYRVQLARTIGIYQLSIAWTDTDNKFFGPSNWGNSKVIATIAANF